MTDDATLVELLGNLRVRFWMCPVEEHGEGPLRVTVEWRAGVAYCTWPGCPRTSIDGDPRG